MSNRPDGKTNFSSHKVRSFESTIFHSDHFQVYEVIKKYLISNKNKRVVIVPHIYKEDVFDYSKNSFVQFIKISGHILDETVNDIDIFEVLYLFFENIFIELNMTELSFLYNSYNDDNVNISVVHKIYKNEKRILSLN